MYTFTMVNVIKKKIVIIKNKESMNEVMVEASFSNDAVIFMKENVSNRNE